MAEVDISKHLGLADEMARKIASRYRRVPLADLRQEAVIALHQAAKRYKPSIGPFEHYARSVISPYLRAIALKLMCWPLHAVDHRTIRKWRLYNQETVDAETTWDLAGPTDTRLSPEWAHVARNLEYLSARERFVLEAVYYAGRMYSEIATDMGVSQARVFQIHATALQVLKDGPDVRKSNCPVCGKRIVDIRAHLWRQHGARLAASEPTV